MSTHPFLDAAQKYAARYRWRLIPLAEGTKNQPLIKGGDGWVNASRDANKLDEWWAAEPNANVAVRCSSTDGPLILDVEGPQKVGVGAARFKAAVEFIEGLNLPLTRIAQTPSGGLHYYFAPDGRPFKRRIKPLSDDGEKLAIDLLGDGGYAVAPPSIIGSDGSGYRWLNHAPLAPLPPQLRELFEGSPTNGRDKERPFDLRKQRLPDVIPEGERDNTLTSLAGTMRRRGASEAAILAALREENKTRCKPPLADKQVRKIARSIAKKRPDDVDPALHELNKKFAVVKVGGDRVIMEERVDGSVDFLTKSAFTLWLSDRFVDIPTKDRPVPLSQAWLSWPARRRFEGVVFRPGATTVVDDEFNLWRGWAIEPSREGSCERFLSHLRHVVCRDNEAHYEWLLDWFADIVQHPQRKIGIAVALKGPQGAGKSIVGDVMRKILGRYQTVAEKPEHVVGRFNGHLAYCLLVQAEEAFWGGDRNDAVLKHLVTGDRLMIDRKGIDSIEMDNYTRLLITTNSEWYWPTAMDDRRLVAFEVRGKYRGNKTYFDRLAREMFERGGCARLLHELLARRINDKRLRTPPVTRALEEQALHSMPPEETWLRDLLERGELPTDSRVDDDGRAHVPIRALHEAYRRTLPRGKHVMNPQAFGKFVSRHLPRVRGVAYRGRHYANVGDSMTSTRSKVRVIDTLERCRDRYSSRGRAAPKTWPNRRGWKLEGEDD